MATRSKTTALSNWDEELAKQAQIAAGMEEGVATGQFFSVKAGVLTWNDAPIKGNEMGVIILDSILENTYYDKEYDPTNPSAPHCFAFGRDDKTMSPHKIVVEAGYQQHATCAGCPMNEFGTADKGRGKACKNTRRLSMIPGGTILKDGTFEEADLDTIESAAAGFMKLPVTSVRAYAAYVKTLSATIKRPPFGVFTRVSVVPDPKTQFQITFELLGKVPNELMEVVLRRHKEAQSLIDFPYQLDDEDAAPAKPARRGATAAKPAVKRGARKY